MRKNNTPVSVPVWYDWSNGLVSMFAVATSPKIARLKAKPKASLLVVNNLDEVEAWVAFDGDVKISTEDGMELAEKLAARYWGFSQPRQAKMLDE